MVKKLIRGVVLLVCFLIALPIIIHWLPSLIIGVLGGLWQIVFGGAGGASHILLGAFLTLFVAGALARITGLSGGSGRERRARANADYRGRKSVRRPAEEVPLHDADGAGSSDVDPPLDMNAV